MQDECITNERQWLETKCRQIGAIRRFQHIGTVSGLVGLTVAAEGLQAAVGELCRIVPQGPGRSLRAQVVGFTGGRTVLLPLEEHAGIQPGWRVVSSGHPPSVAVGTGLLGRVLNAFGEPVDGRGPLTGDLSWRLLQQRPPQPLGRRRVTEPMFLGIRVIDGLLPCGRGQRMGVFAGAGLGKSVLLGMAARFSNADVNVIALVGERGREVQDFIDRNLRTALSNSVVVVATSDESALLRIAAGLTATTIAEFFRDRGQHVLLIMDSLTRLARAQREVGLAAGEVPTTRGYPPSVYSILPQLLERAGAASHGTISGIYSVLVEGDDLHDPVADIVSATLDGHIVLDRALANAGHYPAVDVTTSVSRLAGDVVDAKHLAAARHIRALLSARKEAQDLLSIGAYRRGTQPAVDRALALEARLQDFVRQNENTYTDPHETRTRLLQLAEAAHILPEAGDA